MLRPHTASCRSSRALCEPRAKAVALDIDVAGERRWAPPRLKQTKTSKDTAMALAQNNQTEELA